MKQLTCEMCGGTDLVKQDGVFICQTCGCKYTVEEAKKMMVEGTVDVTGSTVKVDTSGELANLYQIARRAKDDNNSENAAKYYDMILVKDPTSWEASFYVVYFKAMSCKIAQIQSAAISVSNCEDSVLALIRDNVPEDEQYDAVKEMELRCSLVANMLANGAKSHYDGIGSDIKNNYTQEYVNNACAARDIMYNCGTQIDRIFGGREEIAKLAADAWKSGIEIHTRILPFFADKAGNKRTMISYATKIGKYDSTYSRDYVYREKKKMLEDELASLKTNLSTVENKTEQSKGTMMGMGIFFAILGVVFIFAGISLETGLVIGIGIFEICIGLLMAWAGASAGKSAKQIAENKQKRISELKSQIEAKQKELNELKR